MFFDATPPAKNDFDIKLYFEARFRYERRIDRDFSANLSDNRSDLVWRFRPGFVWTYGTSWSGEFQYQYAADSIMRLSGDVTDEFSGVSLLNAKLRSGAGAWTFGRQKVSVGSERLIGAGEWTPTGRTFDGVRYQQGKLDAFAMKVGNGSPKPANLRLAGATLSTDYGTFGLVFKHDRPAAASTDVWTLAHAYSKVFGKVTFEEEAAVQQGRTANKDLQAWAYHTNFSYTPCPDGKLYVEFNAASGGSDATTVRTFDNLSPTNHKFYGSMDLMSWRNMNEAVVGFDRKIGAKVTAKAHYHVFSLRDARDSWYGASGSVNSGAGGPFTDATGASGRDIGKEFDFELQYKHDANTTVSIGTSVFWPGNYVKNIVTNAGQPYDKQTWFFLQVGTKF